MLRDELSFTNKVAYISTKEYIDGYRDIKRFLSYCKKCRSYEKTWACPPFCFDVDNYVSRFQHTFIIGTKIDFSEDIRRLSNSVEMRDELSSDAMHVAVDCLRTLHDRLLQLFPNTISFLVGPCRLCKQEPCARLQGLPCRHPSEVRHSIESVGFDVGKTTSDLLGIELKWSTDHNLPEYITIVTALFTSDDSEQFLSKLISMLGNLY